MDKDVPCYGCERRKPLCHGSCEDYKAYHDKRRARAELIRHKRNEESMVLDTHIRAVQKIKKRK